MTYIPVGTLLTYTAQVQIYLTKGYTDWQSLSTQLKSDLPNLPGLEELDVESANGSLNILSPSTFNISIQVLNNGVDHASETDVQSIIDGTIQGYGNGLISSNISQIQLPNNPGQAPTTINTGATPAAAPPSTPSSVPDLSKLLPSISPTATLTSGFVILIIAIVALILLFPSGFGRALKAVR